MKYAGHPFPSLVWRDLRGNEIPWSSIEDKNRKYEATKDNRSTTLKIRNPKITDSGFYTLYADNGQMQKEQKFRLLVKGICEKYKEFLRDGYDFDLFFRKTSNQHDQCVD